MPESLRKILAPMRLASLGGGSFSAVQSGAHEAASSPHNSREMPTEAQAKAGNYKMGRVNVAGLAINIENPEGSERSGVDPDGTPWTNRMWAHYGYIVGTKGADGDAVDVFVGPWPEGPYAWILNQTKLDGSGFDEHKVLLGFPSAEQALSAYVHSYSPGWKNYHPPIALSFEQLRWWLEWADKTIPFSLDLVPADVPEELEASAMDSVIFSDFASPFPAVAWDATDEPQGESFLDAYIRLRRHDGTDGRMLYPMSLDDLAAEGFTTSALDAAQIEAGMLQPKMEQIMRLMEAASSTVKPIALLPLKMMLKGGKAHVPAIFEMSDGQTVTLWNYSPDLTPAKLSPADPMIIWKVQVNRADFTAAVAPENGKEINHRELARRVMRFIEKNHAAFMRNNAKRAAEAAVIQGLKDELAQKQATLQDLNGQIAEARTAKEARDLALAEQQAAQEKSASTEPAPNDKPSIAEFQSRAEYIGGELLGQRNVLELASMIDNAGTVDGVVPDAVARPVWLAGQSISHLARTGRLDSSLGLVAKSIIGKDASSVIAATAKAGGMGSLSEHAEAFKQIIRDWRGTSATTETAPGSDDFAVMLGLESQADQPQAEPQQVTPEPQPAETTPPASERRRVAALASSVELTELADKAMSAKTPEDLAATEAEIARLRPTTLAAINEERLKLGDLAVAQSVGLGQAEVDDFFSGQNKTGINPNGWGQDGLAMEVSKRRKAALSGDGSADVVSAEGRENPVKTAKGTKVVTGFSVIEADRLIVSHDADGRENPNYPMELQPRDRARAESQAWVKQTANNLDPDSLGRTTRADSGAPIVGPDRVVESGNGRTMAIIEAYRIGKAGEYRAWLESEADYFGINPAKVRAMKRPVLVRVRKSAVDRRAFAVEANQDDKLAMTATEKARSDARRLDDALVAKLSDDGNLLATSNRDFLAGFLQSLGAAEAAQYTTSDGQPTASLIDRVQAAIFAKAYADDRLLELTADAAKPEVANIIAALNAAAPDFIRAMSGNRTGTEDTAQSLTDGIQASLDQQAVKAIIEATNIVKKAKADGTRVEDVIAQQGLFGDIDPAVSAMALFISQNNRSSKRLGTAFKAMANFIGTEAEKSKTADMFGGGEPISLPSVLEAANREMQKQYGEGAFALEQFGLFSQPPQPSPSGINIATHVKDLTDATEGKFDSLPISEHLERIGAAVDALAGAGALTPELDALASRALDRWAGMELVAA